MKASASCLVFLGPLFSARCGAFTAPSPIVRSHGHLMLPTKTPFAVEEVQATTRLQLFPVRAVAEAAISTTPAAALKLCAVFAAALAFLLNAKKILYPSTAPDKAFSEPVPEGSLGCPFAGTPFFIGSKSFGPGAFYMNQAKKLLNKGKGIWKYYFLGTPFVVINGAENLKRILGSEFEPNGIEALADISVKEGEATMMGRSSLVTESKKSRHAFLRRLIGDAITPSAVSKSVPALQQAAEKAVDEMIQQGQHVSMEAICTDFTLDVAWRQILGLNLSEEQIPQFREAVDEWIKGVISPQAIVRIGIKRSKGYKARMFLENLIKEKVADLRKNGPDDSTLSGMVFAQDEENPTRTLTDTEIIDNAMLLILAGSETSASTLMNAMLFLGLQPGTYGQLVEEQKAMQVKHGDALDKATLDKEAPYLEGVIKEAMRLKPIAGGIPRRFKATTIVEGKQVPKGWMIDWNPTLTHYYDPKTYKEDGPHMDITTGFQPERWMKEETTPAAFFPMGTGPRYCLGANLAYAEMKVFLAVLARKVNFRLKHKEPNKVEWRRMGLIPKERDGVIVDVEPTQTLLDFA